MLRERKLGRKGEGWRGSKRGRLRVDKKFGRKLEEMRNSEEERGGMN